MTSVWPRTTFAPIMLGTVIEAIGLGMIAWACWTEKVGNVYGFMAFIGVGFGLRFMAGPLHGIGLFRQHRASVVALLALSIPFGGTIGLTIMSTVFNNTSGMDSNEFGDHGTDKSGQGLPESATHDAKMGVVWAFIALVPFGLVVSNSQSFEDDKRSTNSPRPQALVAACCIGNVKLGQGTGNPEDGGDNIVIREVYLLTLLRGSRRTDAESLTSGVELQQPRSRKEDTRSG